MRLFQNSGVYRSYLPVLRRQTRQCRSFAEHLGGFLHDRYGAAHLLQPVLQQQADAFFTNGDDAVLQQAWAREQGMPAATALPEILLAQLEQHRAEVFYNMDPMRYGAAFLKRLPACVRRTVGWRAAPSAGGNFAGFDLMVCNFPAILQSYRDAGIAAAYFSPAHDPEMDAYAANPRRPVDVLFVGGYSRHHQRRAEVLEAVAALASQGRVVFHLDRSRMTRLAESPLSLGLLARHRRPAAIRRVTAEPVYGRGLYQALSQAKIVLNGAVDMAGQERGNMRCFEALGCGALLVSDTGLYPQGMVDGHTLLAYGSASQAVQHIRRMLAEADACSALARQGHDMVRSTYTKERQWQDFQALVA